MGWCANAQTLAGPSRVPHHHDGAPLALVAPSLLSKHLDLGFLLLTHLETLSAAALAFSLLRKFNADGLEKEREFV